MRQPASLWREMTLVALRSIRGQALRTTLTIGIIGMGIMALIAMVTATESLKANVTQEFSSLGTQSFSIDQMRSGGMFQGKRVLPSPPIDFRQASQFKNEAAGAFKVATSVFGTGMASVTRGNQRTDPNVSVQGVDELYLDVSGLSLAQGRNFTLAEVQSGASIVMVGQSVVDRLFESWEDPVGQHVLVGSQRYSIVGILEARGTSFGRSQDNQILMPIQGVRRQYSDEGRSYNLTCTVAQTEDMPEAVEQATGWMRVVRGDAPGKPNSFLIRQSNRLVDTLLEATDGITMAAVFIGLITLFGAGIGLMNIMLVSVSERTREIGTRKSLGATGAAIRTQFLAEVLVIGQLGGIVGISLGLVVGNLIANAFDTPFIVPWAWVVTGVLLCLVTSLASGYYPARLASKLDPIVALGRE
ncbi:MAG: ABC transporter [Crocinitomicaceae bacterium]|nr:ABC transporter [Crocinitomicaceae bacterium]